MLYLRIKIKNNHGINFKGKKVRLKLWSDYLFSMGLCYLPYWWKETDGASSEVCWPAWALAWVRTKGLNIAEGKKIKIIIKYTKAPALICHDSECLDSVPWNTEPSRGSTWQHRPGNPLRRAVRAVVGTVALTICGTKQVGCECPVSHTGQILPCRGSAEFM